MTVNTGNACVWTAASLHSTNHTDYTSKHKHTCMLKPTQGGPMAAAQAAETALINAAKFFDIYSTSSAPQGDHYRTCESRAASGSKKPHDSLATEHQPHASASAAAASPPRSYHAANVSADARGHAHTPPRLAADAVRRDAQTNQSPARARRDSESSSTKL